MLERKGHCEKDDCLDGVGQQLSRESSIGVNKTKGWDGIGKDKNIEDLQIIHELVDSDRQINNQIHIDQFQRLLAQIPVSVHQFCTTMRTHIT